MPRKHRVVWPYSPETEPDVGRKCVMEVTGVDVKGEDAIVELRHLDGRYRGATRKIALPLPWGPIGVTGAFCKACGLPEGGDLEPDGAKGSLVWVLFGRSPLGHVEAISFDHFEKEGDHDATA